MSTENVEKGQVYQNLKTGDLYEIIEGNAINTTNRFDGMQMVVYKRYDPSGELDPEQKVFTREKWQFKRKFELVEDED